MKTGESHVFVGQGLKSAAHLVLGTQSYGICRKTIEIYCFRSSIYTLRSSPTTKLSPPAFQLAKIVKFLRMTMKSGPSHILKRFGSRF